MSHANGSDLEGPDTSITGLRPLIAADAPGDLSSIEHSQDPSAPFDMEIAPLDFHSPKSAKEPGGTPPMENLEESAATFDMSSKKLLEITASHTSNLNETAQLPLEKFELFSRLPAELRVMIWRLALPVRRVVEVSEGDRLREEHVKSFGAYCGDFALSSGWTRSPPVLLHANKESRLEALRYYELVPLRELRCDGGGWRDGDAKIYFDFATDVIFVSQATTSLSWPSYSWPGPWSWQFKSTVGMDGGDVMKRVKHLAIDYKELIYQGAHGISAYESYMQIVTTCPALETLTFVRDWTSWNLPWNMDSWPEDFEKSFSERADKGILGLSHQSFCWYERIATEDWETARKEVMSTKTGDKVGFYNEFVNLTTSDTLHPKLLQMAYCGTGEFIPPHGDFLESNEEGPDQENCLKGPEVASLPEKIKQGLEMIKKLPIEEA